MSNEYNSRTVEYDADTMRALLDVVVTLTKFKASLVEHVAIESFAPLLFANLLHALDGSYGAPDK